MLGIRIIRGGGGLRSEFEYMECLFDIGFFSCEIIFGRVGLPPAEGQTGSMVIEGHFEKEGTLFSSKFEFCL